MDFVCRAWRPEYRGERSYGEREGRGDARDSDAAKV